MRQLLATLLFSLVSITGLGADHLGNEVGNGGDGIASQFVKRGYVLLSILNTSTANADLLSKAQIDALEKAIRETRVVVVWGDLKDNQGQPVEARNVSDPHRPSKKIIELKKSAWEKYFERGSNDVYRLIFHEYLLVAGIDDTNYVISHLLKIEPSTDEDLSVRTCGLSGTVQERIGECGRPFEEGGFGELAVKVAPVSDEEQDELSTFDDPQFYVWRLVTRTEDKDQFWFDEKAKVIWSDKSRETFETARRIANPAADDYCGSLGKRTFKSSYGEKFSLPTQKIFEIAIQHQMRKILPRIASKFWLLLDSGGYYGPYDAIFYGHLLNHPHPIFRHNDHPEDETNSSYYSNTYVRCVAKIGKSSPDKGRNAN